MFMAITLVATLAMTGCSTFLPTAYRANAIVKAACNRIANAYVSASDGKVIIIEKAKPPTEPIH